MVAMQNRVPVSHAAVYKRLARRLAQDGLLLRTNRSGRWLQDLGWYYAVDYNTNTVMHTSRDLESWAREEGVLKDFEEYRPDTEQE
jgi:hypothetical protein